MQHCPSSTLRQEMYLAKMAVGAAGDAYDNRELIRRLVNLRLELAQLLGSKSFAEKVLARRMQVARRQSMGCSTSSSRLTSLWLRRSLQQ